MQSIFLRAFALLLLCMGGNLLPAQNAFITMDFRNCGMGLKDSTGKWLCDPVYESIEQLWGDYFRVYFGSREGVLRGDGQLVVPAIYDRVLGEQVYFPDSAQIVFQVMRNEKWGLVDSVHQQLLPMVYRDISVYDDGVIVMQTAKKRYSLCNLAVRLPGGQLKEFPLDDTYPEAPVPLGDHLLRVTKNHFGVSTRLKYKRGGIFRKKSRRRYRRAVTRLCLKQRDGVITDSGKVIVPAN